MNNRRRSPNWLQSAGPICLVDIGAGGGITALARVADVVDAHGFDPNKLFLEERSEERYFRKRGLKGIPNYRSLTLHALAISGVSGERDFNLTSSHSDGSFLEPNLEAISTLHPRSRVEDFKVIEVKPVASISVNQWIEQHNVPEIIYMKVDTQGTENEILSSISDDNLPHVVYTEAQVFPLYKQQSTFADIYQTLTAKNYTLLTVDGVPVRHFETRSPRFRVGWFNATFALDLSDATQDLQLKQIAALAVDGHVDYASHLLEKYDIASIDLSPIAPTYPLLKGFMKRVASKILR
jgi:FkbM family methyltransferase